MLEFENQMILDMVGGDSLLITGKGMSLENVILSMIKVYCDPSHLVFVLGATADEEDYFINQCRDQKVSPLPKVITAEITTSEREQVYSGGGVMFISSRIFVVDLLKKRVPTPYISGLMILRAHRILDLCQDAFAIRLFRQENSKGFIYAWSRSPVSFTLGMLKLDRIMKTLFVDKLHLWPRFQALVSDSLKKREQPKVIEIHIPLTASMDTIQTSVLDLIHFCIKEIKRINPSLSTEDITVENALSKSFHKMLQRQLDPVWNQLSSKTKELVADLKILRSVLVHLTESDSVRLHAFLCKLRTKEYILKNSGWMMLDSAETMFVAAKKRLFDAKENLSPERQPKWDSLNDILLEIRRESSSKRYNVLVLVDSPFTIVQLKQVLTMGADKMLKNWYYTLFGKESLSKSKEPAKSKESVEQSDDVDEKNSDTLLLNELALETEEDAELDTITLTQKDDGDMNATFVEYEATESLDPVIVIRQFKKDGDGLGLPKFLQEFKPSAIVMYDTEVSVIRQIEIYQATHSEEQLKVYFAIYGGSVEEQAYLTTLRQEKEAFEFLIKEKSRLVFEDPRALGLASRNTIEAKSSSRHGGENDTPSNPRVIVDMREFRSELPALIHKRGIDIEPVTLQIGDYIISPEMCLERKSISDLIGSLNSGRLYTQALAMTRHYTKPILLIEFDENKPFAMQGRLYLSNDVSTNDIRSKLQLLTLHFPKLRIVWSPSPFASAQLIQELKEGREEPDASKAAVIGVEESEALKTDKISDKFNPVIHDFVCKLPGVNSKNVFSILSKGKSLQHLISCSQDELSEIVGNKVNGELLYKAFHSAHQPVENAPSYRAKPKGRGRGRK